MTLTLTDYSYLHKRLKDMTNNDKIKYINKCLYDLFEKINQNNIVMKKMLNIF